VNSIEPGSPRPLGVTWTGRGVNFAVFSSIATRVELVFYDPASGRESARYDLPARSGDIWHGALTPEQAALGAHYAFCVHGPQDPEHGYRCDATAALIDPYAHELTAGPPYRSRVADRRFDWGDDHPPSIPWRDSVLYELHVKGYTQLHPGVPEAWRGKYLGLTAPPVLEHLRAIGVTAVELLPCQAFLSEPFLRERELTNYWGYNQVAWFAPAREYAIADPIAEFKTMVKALHGAGIEVILDVVFNHTAEGNETGPLLSLRGLDNPVYYRLVADDPRLYENFSGCGNTVNCEHPQVRALIIDCLRYWVEEMHVDGFRFDLATVLGRNGSGFDEHSPFFKALRVERALAYIKLIAEPWDVGGAGYQLGRFPAGWSEWNDKYRDTMRAFWRGDGGKVGELAERLAGSSDLFRHNGRKPTAGVNFITSHDGFTLCDLVSYSERHNEANRESNVDGHAHNLSWNCGVEGPTDDAGIRELRKRAMRNLLATLLLSQGVPMLQAGDEFGRTQRGNNNAYCQDNEISWVDWRLQAEHADLVRFVALLAQLRREHPEFRRETFLKGAVTRATTKDVSWLTARGTELKPAEWQDGGMSTLGVWFGKRDSVAGRLLLLLNAADAPHVFNIPPPPEGRAWIRRFDTAAPQEAALLSPESAQQYPLQAHSAALLEC
jgi:glycogen operon protein